MCRYRLVPLFCIASFLGWAPSAVAGPKNAPSPRIQTRPMQPVLGRQERRPANAFEDTLQNIFNAEVQRLSKDPHVIGALRFSSSSEVVKAAIIAAGRIGDPFFLEEVNRFVNSKNREFRAAAIFALSIMGGSAVQTILSQHLELYRDPEIKRWLLLALGRVGNQTHLPLILKYLNDPDSYLSASAAEAIGYIWTSDRDPASPEPSLIPRLLVMAGSSEEASLAAAFALTRFPGDLALIAPNQLVDAASQTKSKTALALLCRTMGKTKNPIFLPTLVTQATKGSTAGIRGEAIVALGKLPSSTESINSLLLALKDPTVMNVAEALDSLTAYGAKAAAATASVLTTYQEHPSNWVKGLGLRTLSSINPEIGRQRVTAVLKVPQSPLFRWAIPALAVLGEDRDLKLLTPYLSSTNLILAEDSLQSLHFLSGDKISPEMKENILKSLERADVALISIIAELAEKFEWKNLTPVFAKLYPSLQSIELTEAKVAILQNIELYGNASYEALLRSALADSDRLVAGAAASAIKKHLGEDLSSQVPLNSKLNLITPPYREALAATRSQVVMTTNRGTLRIKMLPDAPLNALNFIRLVASGFYNGKIFHRIVPNFVVQGGDPRGDGYGGPGYFIRDEASPRRHRRGSLGIATAGKDTGGCQFFFNLADNLHLAGRYTQFAEVSEDSLSVIEKLEYGDRIISATVH